MILIGPMSDEYEYNNFWIYSNISFEKLFVYSEPFIELYISKNYVIVVKEDGHWLLEFEQRFNPKESIVLKSKTYLTQLATYNCFFQYPYVSFYTRVLNPQLVLYDVRTLVNLVEKHKIEVPQNYTIKHLTNKYLLFEPYEGNLPILVLMLDTFEKKIVNIDVWQSIYYDDNMIFVKNIKHDNTVIDCYDLETNTKTSVTSDLKIGSVTKRLVIKIRKDVVDVCQWNSDYTQMNYLISLDRDYNHVWEIECLDFTMPFVFFHETLIAPGRFWIFTKNNEQIAEITLSLHYREPRGDSKGRIYFKQVINGRYEMSVIDFLQ